MIDQLFLINNDWKTKKDIKNFFSKTSKFIDLEIEIKNKFENPKIIYPYQLYGHFNELGYQFLSKVILKNIEWKKKWKSLRIRILE